jgi:hypothetical protein
MLVGEAAMPVHDWPRAFAGLFHDFYGEWIRAIKGALNAGILPPNYYALAEQRTAGVEPDVLTLGRDRPDAGPSADPAAGGGLLLAPPRARVVAESDLAAYRRKQNRITVRHASDDSVAAVVEVVSPGNKAGRHHLAAFVGKSADLIAADIHLLVLDIHPPTKWAPHGIHAALWEEIDGADYRPPADKPFTLASYEAGPTVRAYVEPAAVGDVLPDMPLFLVPGGHVTVPVEATYQTAWAAVPLRWRREIEAAG